MNFRRVLTAALVAVTLVGCAEGHPSSRVLEIGEVGTLAGLRISVTQVVVGGDDGGPWFQVWMRMKNASDHQVAIPAAAIVCADEGAEGSLAAMQDRRYSLKPGVRIVVGSSAAGVMWLLPPARPCAKPAVVKVTSGGQMLKVEIPNSVVDGLNSY